MQKKSRILQLLEVQLLRKKNLNFLPLPSKKIFKGLTPLKMIRVCKRAVKITPIIKIQIVGLVQYQASTIRVKLKKKLVTQ